jgi:hypothetical protein
MKKVNPKIYLIFIVSIFVFQISSAQENKETSTENYKLYKTQLSYQKGYVFPTNNFVRGINTLHDTIDDFQTISGKFTKQTFGKKRWEQVYHYPEYGGGIYLADFYNSAEIGFPIALYGYFQAPLIRREKFTFNYELGLGLAFNWKNYSPANVYNNAIGAKRTVYVDLGLNTEFKIKNRLYLSAGFSLSHFSNGRLKDPNLGLNTIAPKISLKYDINNNKQKFIIQEIPKFIKKNEFNITLFGGSKNIIYDSIDIAILEKYEGVYFPVIGISTTFNRQVSFKSKLGMGVSFCYDGSINAQIAVENGELEPADGPIKDNLQLSIFPSYEHVINRVSLILQPSFYIYRLKTENMSTVFYQRIGLKYNFYKNFYVGINLRAYKFSVSDFIEWNAGYYFQKKKLS